MINESVVATIASLITAIVAVFSLCRSVKTQKDIQKNEVKRATIDAFSKLQEDVLDKLVSEDKANAAIIAEERNDNEECKKAYNDYKTLVARLDHFSIGIEQGVYDLDVVDKLAGEHLVFLLPKIEPIIDAANEHLKTDKYYQNYVKLVEQLKKRHAMK